MQVRKQESMHTLDKELDLLFSHMLSAQDWSLACWTALDQASKPALIAMMLVWYANQVGFIGLRFSNLRLSY